VEQSGSSRGS